MAAVRKGPKKSVPDNYTAAEILVAVVKVVGVVQLVMFGGGEKQVPNARAQRKVGVGNPTVDETQRAANGNHLGTSTQQRKNDRR